MTGFAVSCARGRSCKCCFLVATGFSSCLRSHVPYFIIFYSEHMIAASDLSRLHPDFVIVVWYNRTNFPKLPKFTIWEFSYYSTILSMIICSASQVDDGRVAEEGGRHGSGRNCLRNGSEDRIVCPLIANIGNLLTELWPRSSTKQNGNRIFFKFKLQLWLPRYRQARLRSRRLQQWQRWCRTRRQRQVQLQGAAKQEIRHEVFRK